MSFEFTLYDALLSIEVPAEKAPAVIDALEHDMGSTLATKQDISSLALATKQDIAAVKQDIAALAAATKQDIASLESETRQEFVLVRREMQAIKQDLEHRMDLLQSTIIIRLGSFMVVAMGLLFAALKLT